MDTWLEDSPRDVGYGGAGLATERLRDRIHDTVDVEYSEAHIHRRFVPFLAAISSNRKYHILFRWKVVYCLKI